MCRNVTLPYSGLAGSSILSSMPTKSETRPPSFELFGTYVSLWGEKYAPKRDFARQRFGGEAVSLAVRQIKSETGPPSFELFGTSSAYILYRLYKLEREPP